MLVTIVAITTLALVGFGVPLAVAVSSNYRSSARLELQKEASGTSTDVPATLLASGQLVKLPGGEGDADTTIALYDGAGRLMAGVGPVKADPVVMAAFEGEATDGSAGGELIAAVPISLDERVVGAVRAARAERVVRGQIWRAWGLMATLALVVVAAAAVVARWQARRLSRPLEELAGVARQLGDGDFTVRTQPSGFVEIDDAGRALDRTAGRLGVMLDRERQFSADVSHQLRTPLTAMRLDLDNALTTPGVEPRAAILEAFEAMDRMETTIDDLISLRRDEASGGEELDPIAVFGELEDTWHGALAEQGRPLRISFPDTPRRIAVSAAAVRQVLAVLVGNAAEHGAGTVSVVASLETSGLRLDVSDDGEGLTSDTDVAFSRRADRASGRGIGLPLARSLIEAEGGQILYRGPPHPGFTVLLPLRPHPNASTRRRHR